MSTSEIDKRAADAAALARIADQKAAVAQRASAAEHERLARLEKQRSITP